MHRLCPIQKVSVGQRNAQGVGSPWKDLCELKYSKPCGRASSYCAKALRCDYTPPPKPLRAFGRGEPETTFFDVSLETFDSAFACSACACSCVCSFAGLVSGPFVFDSCARFTLGEKICLPRYIPVASSRWCGRRRLLLSLSCTTLISCSA